jgi:membrane protein YdbS with pleckstrin-like domain
MSGGAGPVFPRWLHLVQPPRDEQVLVEDEQVVYRRPQHWMVLLPAVLRTLAVFWIALLVVLGLPFATMTAPEWLLTALAAVAVGRWVRERSRRRLAVLALGLLLAAVLFDLGPRGLAGLLVVAALLGLADEVVQWRWYRLLYVTNRRMIQTDGVLTRSFATMPITKITDVRLEVSWLGEWLGYGEFHVESAGQDQALGHLVFLLDADHFYRVVLRLATNPVSMDDTGF